MCKNYISANKYFINPFILTSIITMDRSSDRKPEEKQYNYVLELQWLKILPPFILSNSSLMPNVYVS